MPHPDPRRRPVPVPPPRPVANYAPLALDPALRAELTPIPEGARTALAGRVFRITNWERWPMEKRIAYLHALTADWAKDPAIMALATSIIRKANVESRQYRDQWAALLAWTQTHLLYVNEPGERICSPQRTLSVGAGDCDDLAIVVGALGESLRLPWAFTISGTTTSGQKTRWVEGSGPPPAGVTWAHIYLCVGYPPFKPATWLSAEPTMRVPLGWDCVTAPRDRSGRFVLPEMGDLGVPGGRGDALPDRPAARRPGLNGTGFAGIPDGSTGYGKGDARRYTGAAHGGTTGRPGATIGLNTGTGQSWPGAALPTYGTADLSNPATSPVFAAVTATVADAPAPVAPAPVAPAPVAPAPGKTPPTSKVRDVFSQVSIPQVLTIVLAGALTFALTQGVLAPSFRRRRAR